MKYTVAAIALAAGVSAQSLSDIPSCAIPCIDASRTKVTSCSETDYVCICDSIDALTADATTCVLSDCGADVAVNDVLPAVDTFCSEVSAGGGSSTTEAATSTATSVAATTTEASTSAVETSAAESSSSEATTTAAVSSSKATTATTAVVTTSASSNSTATKTSSPSSVVTAGAAVATAGSIGMLLLGALAAL